MSESVIPFIKSETDALSLLEQMLSKKDINIDTEEFLRSFDWAQLKIYIPHPPKDASVSPPLMEAYIRLQKSIYQTVALAKYGQGHIQKLSEDDKEKYEISVVVEKGSSDQTVDLSAILTTLAKDLAGKMTPEQIFYFVCLVAVLYTGHSAWKLFLQHRKDIRMGEISSEERKRTIQGFETLQAEETSRLDKVLSQSSKTIELGHEIIKRAEITNEAFLKAAGEVKDAKIQDVTIPAGIAQELRTSPRRKASIYVVEKEMRVVDVNTQDELKIIAYLEDSETLDIIKIEFKDAILAGNSRGALFSALEQRVPAIIKMRVKDLEGDITPIELLNVSLPTAENQ